MKKGSGFEKFYKGKEKTGGAKKEQIRQEKREVRKEREEKIADAKRQKRAAKAERNQPPKYNLEPPASRFSKRKDEEKRPRFNAGPSSSGRDARKGEGKSFDRTQKRTPFKSNGDRPFPRKQNEGDGQRPTRKNFDDDRREGRPPAKSVGQGPRQRSEGERPKKTFGPPQRNNGDRPQKNFDDRPKKNFGNRPQNGGYDRQPERQEPDASPLQGVKPNKDKPALQTKQSGGGKVTIKKNPANAPSDLMPLNKYIAHSGVCSRRDAVDVIKSGKVKVNGELILEPGHKVAVSDEVKVAGKKLNPVRDFIYILLNKPKDYITTTEDPQERKTVLDLLQTAPDTRIYPVGRLDRNTSGVLLLTNDGDLAQKLTHPSHEIKKVYAVTLDKPLTKNHFEEILRGVELEDGPAKVDVLAYADPKDLTQVGVEIHSGRNRIVRRIFEHLGYDVKALDRVIFAGLTKKNVNRGKWRFLTEKEVRDLKFFKKGRG